LLWDVGAGSGSIGIEWLLAHPSTRAIGIERDDVRAARASRNAASLGVPHYDVRHGAAPAALVGLPEPDAIFIGGGSAADAATIDACWLALKPGGRIVVNGVTLETELALLAARRNADANQYRACRTNRRTLRLAAGTAGSAMGLPETGG
jgi:precorrin-6Y C5,15-methyltransferase (decarboxylating)